MNCKTCGNDPKLAISSVQFEPDVLTARDRFAMAALTGMIANPSARAYMERASIKQTDAEMFADYAYEQADALLATRSSKEE